ncbi:hypothetical protein [Paenibacillus sophorae]|uniref:hypothetical protein n=1 Tax=Paenibacillus sophorae TaxID=1333845 RepID=UPI0015873E56|nr:hypothetical protein [Paenibacillus sophorae]
MVVEHHLNPKIGWVVGIQHTQKINEFFAAITINDRTLYLAADQINRCHQHHK